MPGVSVTATNLGTQYSRSTTTDAEGQYALRLLPLGHVQARGHPDRLQDLLADRHPRRGGPQRPHRRDPRGGRHRGGHLGRRPTPPSSRRARPPSRGRSARRRSSTSRSSTATLYSLLSITGGVSSNTNENFLGAPGQFTTINGSTRGQMGTRQLPARRRQQHGGPARHRQRGAEPGGGPGVPGRHEQLRRRSTAATRRASSTSSRSPAPTSSTAPCTSTSGTRA